MLLSCKATSRWPVHRQRKEQLARNQLRQRANAKGARRKRWMMCIRVKKRFRSSVKMKWNLRFDWSMKSCPTRSSIFSPIISTGMFLGDYQRTDMIDWWACFSTKSRLYLDLFIQRVKESFTQKESEASSDATRKSDMKSTQETIKQLHGNIFVFSHSIEQFLAENETNLSKDRLSVKKVHFSNFCFSSSWCFATTFDSFSVLGSVRLCDTGTGSIGEQ